MPVANERPHQPPKQPPMPHLPFPTRDALAAWLADNHDSANELWVQVFKKASGRESVTGEDCVIAALAWGWIDGQRRALDDESFVQRLTPRRARSGWSKRNCEHAERMIAAGEMAAPGLAQVEAARADGRWEAAYAGSANMVLPDDFFAALRAVPEAEAAFAKLRRAELFSIYYRVTTAKRAETRARRIADAVAALAGSAPATDR